ncbi:hypothetical protein HF895_05480 [Bacteroides sp. AN502]|nr:hypothetical protein [Caecibacteroides pullorum]
MKRTIFISALTLIGTASYSQSYNDFFTTYKDISTQTIQKKQSYGSNNGGSYNNGITQYDVLDANTFIQDVSPQNIQIVNGIYLYAGQFYSVKLKIGVSGTNKNQIMVCAYWDGQIWNNITYYASPIGYDAPEQIRRACAYQVYIETLGTVYF